jgi:hypothetical protein
MRRTAFVGRFDVGTKVGENEQAEIAVAAGAPRLRSRNRPGDRLKSVPAVS